MKNKKRNMKSNGDDSKTIEDIKKYLEKCKI